MSLRKTVDHLILGAADLDRGIEWVEQRTGVRAEVAGSHPGRGTRNALLSLGGRQYLEIMAPDPAQEPTPQSAGLSRLRECRLVWWAAAADDLEAISRRMREAGHHPLDPRPGSRVRPDGRTLTWRTLNIEHSFAGNGVDPIPFFIQWSADSVHPSQDSPAGCTLAAFEIEHPEATAVSDLLAQLGISATVSRGSAPNLIASLACPKGRARLE